MSVSSPPPPPDRAVAHTPASGVTDDTTPGNRDACVGRAYARVFSMDEAFWIGYQSLVKATRPQPQRAADGGRPRARSRRTSTLSVLMDDAAAEDEEDATYLDAPVSHVVTTFPDYLAVRSQLLGIKMAARLGEREGEGQHPAPPPTAPHASFSPDRFSLDAVTVAGVEAPTLEPSPDDHNYVAWRRRLLALKFERRRAACEDEELRRMAAEAMQRAMVAEQTERQKHMEIEEALLRAEAADDDDDDEEEEDDRGWGPDGPLTELYAPRGLTYRVGVQFALDAVSAALPPSAWRASMSDAGQALALLPRTGLRDAATASGVRVPLCAKFMPGSHDHFAVAYSDGVVALCSAVTGVVWAVLPGHMGAVNDLDWGGGGMYLLTTSMDKTARLWAVSAPKDAPLPAGGEKDDTNGAAAATTTTSTTALPTPVGSATCVRILYQSNPVTHAAFFPMNPNLFVLAEVVVPAAGAHAVASGGRRLLRRGGQWLRHRLQSRRAALHVVNVSTGKVVTSFKLSAQVTALTFSANGRHLYVADSSGLLHLYTTESDFQKQASKPFAEHQTIFGRTDTHSLLHRSNDRRHGHHYGSGGGGGGGGGGQDQHRRSARRRVGGGASSAGGGSGRPPTSGVGGGGSDIHSTRRLGLRHKVAGMLRRRFGQAAATYFVDLHFKPYDAYLHCPVLVGTDSNGMVRALKLLDGRPDDVALADFVVKPVVGAFVHQTVSLPSVNTDYVFAGTEHGEVHLLNPRGHTQAAQRVARLAGHARQVAAATLSHDETVLVTADETGALVVWNRVKRVLVDVGDVSSGGGGGGGGIGAAAGSGGGGGAGVGSGVASLSTPRSVAGSSVGSPRKKKATQSLCPVCQRPIPDDKMLTHVEQCLESSGM